MRVYMLQVLNQIHIRPKYKPKTVLRYRGLLVPLTNRVDCIEQERLKSCKNYGRKANTRMHKCNCDVKVTLELAAQAPASRPELDEGCT